MKLAVFSDLHLAPHGTNRCTASAEELLALFDRAEDVADRVLVAGDLFDLDRPTIPGHWRGQWEAIRRDFPEVCRRLDGYEWIFGNHDESLRRAGVPEERVYMADGLRVIATHGHQWDMLLKKMPVLEPTANFVAGWFERAALSGVSQRMQRAPLLLDRLWHSRSTSNPGPDRLLRGAAELLEEGWDIVLSGHSHRLRLVATGRGLLVNTGALCAGGVDWALVDTAAARVRAFRDGELVQEARRADHLWHVDGEEPTFR